MLILLKTDRTLYCCAADIFTEITIILCLSELRSFINIDFDDIFGLGVHIKRHGVSNQCQGCARLTAGVHQLKVQVQYAAN